MAIERIDMWALSGGIEEFGDWGRLTLLALFTTKKKAKDYVEKSKLVRPVIGGGPFKKRSVLHGYNVADIEEYGRTDYPINPKL